MNRVQVGLLATNLPDTGEWYTKPLLGSERQGRGVRQEGGGAFEADGAVAVSRALDFGHLVERCRRMHDETQRLAACAADTYLATRNWLFGWCIAEFEQRGADRAKYGSRLLAKVSRRLQKAGIKGCSATYLKLCRQFNQQQTRIGPTPSDQFVSPLAILSCPLDETITLLAGRILTKPETMTLVTEDRWFTHMRSAIYDEVERLTRRLTARITALAELYARPLPEPGREVEALSAKAEKCLKRMGLAWA